MGGIFVTHSCNHFRPPYNNIISAKSILHKGGNFTKFFPHFLCIVTHKKSPGKQCLSGD